MKSIYRKQLSQATQARRKALNLAQMAFYAPLQYQQEQQPDFFLSPGRAVVGEIRQNFHQLSGKVDCREANVHV